MSLVIDLCGSQVQHALEFDGDEFPTFKDAPYLEVFIKPGDAVYIPPR